MQALERAGISDAQAMPEASDGRRVSVGLFSEKDRAEKRAQAVKRLGYTAEIVERKQPGTVYWVDMDLGANERTVPTEGLLAGDERGSRLEIRVCPEAAPAPVAPKPAPLPRDARPAATTADAGIPARVEVVAEGLVACGLRPVSGVRRTSRRDWVRIATHFGAGLAQLVERQFCKLDVAGSIPAAGISTTSNEIPERPTDVPKVLIFRCFLSHPVSRRPLTA